MCKHMLERDFYFDNAKFILIVFVVFGHLIEPLINQNSMLMNIYLTIYSFHMPSFIIISGYFYKKTVKLSFHQRLLKVFKQLIIPYLIFDVLFWVFYVVTLRQDLRIDFSIPIWLMWFLMSSILWQMLTPYIIRLKHPILLTIVLALVSGYTFHIGYFMSLSRTITFFPFFLIGFYAKREWFNKLHHPAIKFISILLLSLTPLLIHKTNLNNPGWFYGSYAYSSLTIVNQWTWTYRFVVYLISFLNSLGILALIPQFKMPFTKMGSRTMSVYLLHGFIIKYVVFKSTLLHQAKGIGGILILLGFAVIITLILASAILDKIVTQVNDLLKPGLIKPSSNNINRNIKL
ncbi:acyltransferase family protein [Desulfosporosinus sp. FKA]|uniref:acyltransferase family protein n=1 Tax=Desulfosporosinus sp. FKA TaxID=1969834 RepID=UPI000B49E9E5|nr:acyltransferase family protein [Desulfosporosinus sp. FKA]